MNELRRVRGPCIHKFSDWNICYHCNKPDDATDWLEWEDVMEAEKKGGHRAVEDLVRKYIGPDARDNLIVYNKKMEWQWLELDANCLLGLDEISYDIDVEFVWDWPFLLRNDYNYDYGAQIKELTKTANKWLRWLANNSLYAPAFVTKRPHDMLAKGVMYNARAVPTRVLISAMAGVRYVGESPYIPEMWEKWLEYAKTPHEALYLAHCTEFHKDGRAARTYPNNQGHNMWDVTDSLFGRYEYRRLMKGQHVHAPTINDSHSWPDLCRQFGLRQPTPEMQWPRERWMPIQDWFNEFRRLNR